MIDFTEYDDEELDALRIAVTAEQERRHTLTYAAEQSEELARRYLDAAGRTDGSEWVQPTGGHDAYPEGHVVQHNGKEWVSLTPANVWEPGVSGWRENVSEDDDEGGGSAPEWVSPTGEHDAYNVGDRVTFEGRVYVSVTDGNVWSPVDNPAGWSEET